MRRAMSNLLLQSTVSGSIDLDAGALARRDEMLLFSSGVTQVTSSVEQTIAATYGSQIQGWLKDVEVARKAVKEKPLELTRLIDRLAAEASAPALAEKERLGKLTSQFQRAEAARVVREEASRLAAIRAAQAETDRLAAELAAAKKAPDADWDRRIETALAVTQAQEAERAVICAPAPVAEKATGAVVKKVILYEVTDIAALYVAAPHLVRLEPNAAAIRATISATTNIPGLRVWEEIQTSFRSKY